jgi:hypothetical protein
MLRVSSSSRRASSSASFTPDSMTDRGGGGVGRSGVKGRARRARGARAAGARRPRRGHGKGVRGRAPAGLARATGPAGRPRGGGEPAGRGRGWGRGAGGWGLTILEHHKVVAAAGRLGERHRIELLERAHELGQAVLAVDGRDPGAHLVGGRVEGDGELGLAARAQAAHLRHEADLGRAEGEGEGGSAGLGLACEQCMRRAAQARGGRRARGSPLAWRAGGLAPRRPPGAPGPAAPSTR